MKKLMILGAGFPQVKLIQAAKELGCETVVCSIPGDYPGFAAADEISYADISDPEAVLAAARRFRVDGIATCCFETGLRALARACGALGLPGISPRAAEISVNKLAMKRAFQSGGVRSAEYAVVRTPEDLDRAAEKLGFPMVVKAVDLQGSSGVYVVQSGDRARRALDSCLALTGEDYCIAEAFISGDNIGAEAFVQNGRILFVLPNGTISYPGAANIPIGHYAPLDRPEAVLRDIRETVERAVRACGFDNCAVNVDLVLHGGEPYVIELTARAGATCLPELVSIYYGVDYYRMILLAALGRDAAPLFAARSPRPCPCAASMISAPKTGVVRAIRLPEKIPDNVYDLSLIVKEGDPVRQFSNSRDRVGQAIVYGADPASCRRELDALLAQIRIEVE